MASTPATDTILLKGGTFLAHEGTNVQILKGYDLLIEGKEIRKIAKEITPPSRARVVDCTNKIVSPGFIDTHHHMWQSQLKGRHADHGFLDYMLHGSLPSYNYKPDDIYWGQLAGCLESLDSGVTTVVDHAHMTYSADHATAGINASASSGLRIFFCYTAIPRVKEWSSSQLEYEDEVFPEWWHTQLESLARSQPFGDGRVYLGLGFDSWKLPEKDIIDLWTKCRESGIKLFTTHYVVNATPGKFPFPQESGLLKPDLILSHSTGAPDEDYKIIREHGAFVSSTPDTELQMGLGYPVAFRDDIKSNASFGVDLHSNNSADILTQLRIGMQYARAIEDEKRVRNGGHPAVNIKVQEAFNLGTIQGAKAVGMEDKIGSLAEGKLADIVIFDTRSPAMVGAAEEDPLAALVLHASVRDIDTVIVDGKIRKENKTLRPIEVQGAPKFGSGTQIKWADVVDEMLASRAVIKKRSESQSVDVAREVLYRRYSGNPKDTQGSALRLPRVKRTSLYFTRIIMETAFIEKVRLCSTAAADSHDLAWCWDMTAVKLQPVPMLQPKDLSDDFDPTP
ncbi:conserved hypothetical protein [Paecilomyces variotii No. 5]|uniref:Amidohydrolase-related domain-containing protein n=1 Tax=Byssochlamys spectabilis (strain No. 5 / NBRC 109023) TaxID=1356009 RepID=V5F9M6_BYSSN|nr:conserved hypothetical protein [Paecilomyces variotii No. 5]